jgi:hypothetical protein
MMDRRADDPIVALIECRPETVSVDVARLLDLIWPAQERASWRPRWRVASPAAAAWPAGGVAPWLPDLLAQAWGDEPADGEGDDRPETTRDILVAGVTTCRRLHVRGALAASLAWTGPALPWTRLARDPRRLVPRFKHEAVRACGGGVLDLTVIGDGASPTVAEPVMANLLLASRDLVALDAVAADVLGFAGNDGPLIAAAAAAGLGVTDRRRIEQRGDGAGARPSLKTRTAADDAAGWLAEDAPAWLAALWRRWQTDAWPGRGRRRRYRALPWARFASDDARGSAGRDRTGGTP